MKKYNICINGRYAGSFYADRVKFSPPDMFSFYLKGQSINLLTLFLTDGLEIKDADDKVLVGKESLTNVVTS